MKYYKPKLNEKAQTKHAHDDSIVIEMQEFTFDDTRPVVAQLWAESECIFLTYFFSNQELENLTAPEILDYMGKNGLKLQLEKCEYEPSVDKFSDANNNNCIRVTLFIGDLES